MKPDTIEIQVEVTQDDEYGTVFVAIHDELGLVTHGKTFEELPVNLHEALEVSLPDAADLNFVPEPRILFTSNQNSDGAPALPAQEKHITGKPPQGPISRRS